MGKLSITTAVLCASLWLIGCDRRSADQGGTGSASEQQQRERTSGTATRDVDNTGINQRDRAEEALTPGDQGDSPADRDTTRRIRRTITQNDQLSTTAKNIKIITVNGKVTLRGPVKSEAERQQIASLAQSAAGGATIDNQLEVKQTTENK